MGDYSVWYQVFNNDGTINTEDIHHYADTLEEAKQLADENDVIRYYKGCNGNWDWDNPEADNYKEYSVKERR